MLSVSVTAVRGRNSVSGKMLVILFRVKSVGFNGWVGHKVNMLPLLVKVVSIRSILGRGKRLLPVDAVAAGFEL